MYTMLKGFSLPIIQGSILEKFIKSIYDICTVLLMSTFLSEEEFNEVLSAMGSVLIVPLHSQIQDELKEKFIVEFLSYGSISTHIKSRNSLLSSFLSLTVVSEALQTKLVYILFKIDFDSNERNTALLSSYISFMSSLTDLSFQIFSSLMWRTWV